MHNISEDGIQNYFSNRSTGNLGVGEAWDIFKCGK